MIQSFPSTHWSLVGLAADDDAGARRAALGRLLERYLPAMKAHLVRGRRMSESAAEDLVQGFVADKVLDSGFIDKADASRGKFRTFLLTSLNRYVISDARLRTAQKRQPAGGPPAAIDDLAVEPAATGVRDVFESEWARQVLTLALEQMRQYCREQGRDELWALFDERVLQPILHHEPAPAYEQVAERYGFATPTQACNALKTAKRIFERALRSTICEYAGQEQVDAELLDLRQIVSGMPA